MLELVYENSFKKDYKKLVKQNFDDQLLKNALEYLIDDKPLPKVYNNHPLKGDYKGYFDCHLKADCILVYKKSDTKIFLLRIGTHGNIFKKY